MDNFCVGFKIRLRSFIFEAQNQIIFEAQTELFLMAVMRILALHV